MLALCRGRCLLHRHSGKHEVCSESMTKFSSIQFFVRNATISLERNFRNWPTVQ